MTRTSCAAEKKKETLEEVWAALNAWIEARYNEGKGVNVAPFCKISWETVTISRNTRKLRPIFILHETYAKTYGLHYKKRITAPDIAALEDINFTKIAIKFSKNLNKDTVFCGVRDLLHKIGEIASTGAQMSIDMALGKIVAKNRTVHMLFDPKLFPKHLETASTTSAPPSILGDLADFDLLLDESTNPFGDGEEGHLQDEPLAITPGRHPSTPRPVKLQPHRLDTAASPHKTALVLPSVEKPPPILATPPTLSQLRSPRPVSRNGQGYQSVDVPSRDFTTMALSPPQLRQHPAFNEPSFDFSFKEILKHELERSGSSASASATESSVADAAYERHIRRIEKDVELEAQHSMDIHRHHIKDLDEISSEKRKKRANAERLQESIKLQMAAAAAAREKQKRVQNGTDPSENTFLSHSQHSRLGFNSADALKKNQNNMHQYLEAQVKDQKRREARSNALADDKQFLAKLERDIQEDREYVTSEQQRQRQILTQAWEKDHSIKTATKQSRKIMHDRIKTAIATSPARHSAGHQVGDEGGDDFSVGFDSRAKSTGK
ncbi:hypothetical protein DYB34_008977 [Aphanomyces astaci]|uniref:CCDC81 HU domain-containing protein n=1 Tax=Aphanomyces astaci TaxID=112090 RepID=A0A397B874_APHAT|nr:hypothetical protein DYB36_003495 [Aphanomyces astaci]RHY36160.1 hypothetical protein DYB34_008977 [Aphanomyces astaci]